MITFKLTRRKLLASGAVGGLMAMIGPRFASAQDAERHTLRVGMSGFPPAFDPVLYTHTATRRLAPQIFDTLIAYDQTPAMNLRPGLAERWERIDDRSVKLFLRQGATFHDGGAFTAEDVAFSLSPQHLLGPDMAGKATAMETLETIDTVEIIDPHTVIVRAKGNDALLEKRLASWGAEIVSKTAFDAAGSWDAWNAAPIGTGPYRIVSQTLDQEVTLVSHDAYWGGLPPYAGIKFRVIPETASRMNALAAGEVDIITDISPDMFPQIENHPDLEVAGGTVANIRALVIDETDPVLGKVGVRRALSLAIDRKALVQALWGDRLTIPNGYQLSSFGDAYIEDFPQPAYDPDLARQLLAEAGYAGETITYKLLNNYYPNQVSTAQVMVEMWKAVGLNVELQMMENFGQIQTSPVHAIYDSSNTATIPDPLGFPWRIFGPSGQNVRLGLWRNEEYFALGEELKVTVDAERRRPIIRKMLEIVDREDPPIVILHGSGQFYGKRKDVRWVAGQTLDLDFGPFNLASVQD